MTKAEALDMLHKWQDEKKLTFYSVELGDHMLAQGWGHVGIISDASIKLFILHPAHLSESPDLSFLDIPIAGECEYQYKEAHEYHDDAELHELPDLIGPGSQHLGIVTQMNLNFTICAPERDAPAMVD